MPLSRRLSNSSQEAFSEFCEKNKPLSRRPSNGSAASAGRYLSRANSFTMNEASNGKVVAGAKRALTRRMSNSSSRQLSRPSPTEQANPPSPPRGKGGTTNHDDSILQSPTPYWKVAKERGKVSPRETRASKKRKTTGKERGGRALKFDASDGEGRSSKQQKDRKNSGLMLFSPPNQVANAKREMLELEEKRKAREKRISRNKENGQLLVFSTNFENLTPLPADDYEDKDQVAMPAEEEATRMAAESGGCENGEMESSNHEERATDDASFSSVSMDEETRVQASGAEGSVQGSMNEKRTEEMLNVIKGLGKKFENLDRRLSEMHKPIQSAPLPPKPTNEGRMNLEAKMIQIQTLSDLNSVLEKKNEQTVAELRIVESNFSAEREQFVAEMERIQVEFEQAKELNNALETTLQEYKEKIDMLEYQLLPESEGQLRAALEELGRYKDSVDETASRLEGYEEMVRNLSRENERLSREKDEEKNHFQTLNEETFRVHQSMKEQSNEKDRLIKEIQQSLVSVKTELEQERSRTSEKILELEEVLSQLMKVSQERDNVQQKLAAAMDQISKDAEFKNEVYIKSQESSNALEVLDEEKRYLQKRLKDMEKELKSVKEERDGAFSRLGSSDQREEDLFSRLRESDRVRRELHAKVMVLIGSIRVFVRVRPLLAEELEASSVDNSNETGSLEEEIFHFTGMGGSLGAKKSKYGSDDPTKNVLEVIEPLKDRGGLSQRRKKWKFGFDQVFDPSHGQEDVWDASEPLVQSAIDGYNVTIFAYGQTGSGKTHTMIGEVGSPNEGLISRSIRKIFDSKNDIEDLSRGEKKVSLSVELLEVYNEQVRDLLAAKAATSTSGEKCSLKVVANEAVGSIRQAVTNEAEVFKILQKAQERRCVKATSSNATSSRSHMLFTIQFTINSKDGTNQSGKLNICDLAGSERLGKSGANIVGGALLQETKHINLSLSTLSNVIEKLQAGDSNVPYRDSKLTSLLQNSLGGNSKTLCIVCCNPLQAHFHETLCSLRFAAKINKVDLKAIANFSA